MSKPVFRYGPRGLRQLTGEPVFTAWIARGTDPIVHMATSACNGVTVCGTRARGTHWRTAIGTAKTDARYCYRCVYLNELRRQQKAGVEWQECVRPWRMYHRNSRKAQMEAAS